MDTLTINPQPTLNDQNKVTVKEGTIIGPVHCLADCNPSCDVTWKLRTLSDLSSKKGMLLPLVVNRSMEMFRCEARWRIKNEILNKSIGLDVQCKYLFYQFSP